MPIVSPPKPRGKQLEKMSDCSALTEAGHTLQEIVLETSNIDALRSAKDEVKERNAQDIFNAETIAISEANNIASKTGLDWQTRCHQKANLDRLPGLTSPNSGQRHLWRVVYDDRDLLTQGELFWLFIIQTLLNSYSSPVGSVCSKPDRSICSPQ